MYRCCTYVCTYVSVRVVSTYVLRMLGFVLRHAYKVRDACVGQMQMDADL